MSSEGNKLIKTCRLCTKNTESEVANDLFAKCNRTLLHEIKELTGVTLKDMARQNLPRHICSKCKEDLSYTYKFRSQIIMSQSYFKSKDYQRSLNICKEIKQENSAQSFDTIFVPSYDDKIINKLNIKCSDESFGYEDKDYITAAECVESVLAVKDEQQIVQSETRRSSRKRALQNEKEAVLIKMEKNDENNIKIDVKDKNVCEIIATTEFESVETFSNENTTENINLEEDPNYHYSSKSEDSSSEDNDDPGDPEIVFTKKQFKKKPTVNLEEENDSEDLKQCELCESSFKTNSQLNAHYNKEHKGEKKCKLCEQTFLTRKSLERHLRWHKGEEPYKCRFCDIRFKYCKTRSKHERKLHSRDCAYLCSLCGKTFLTTDMGKGHMVVHTKERAFQCTVCNAFFLRKSHLQTHYRSETHKNNEMKMKEQAPTKQTENFELSAQQHYGIQDNLFPQIVPNASGENGPVLQLLTG